MSEVNLYGMDVVMIQYVIFSNVDGINDCSCFSLILRFIAKQKFKDKKSAVRY